MRWPVWATAFIQTESAGSSGQRVALQKDLEGRLVTVIPRVPTDVSQYHFYCLFQFESPVNRMMVDGLGEDMRS